MNCLIRRTRAVHHPAVSTEMICCWIPTLGVSRSWALSMRSSRMQLYGVAPWLSKTYLHNGSN